MDQVTFADVQETSARIGGSVRSATVARIAVDTNTEGSSYDLYFALEFMQHTGSFKARGARDFIRAHREQGSLPDAGVTIASGAMRDVPVDSVAADSLGARRVSAIALATAQNALVRLILVSDQAIVQARQSLWDEYRLAVEHAGATALAGACGAGDYLPAPVRRSASFFAERIPIPPTSYRVDDRSLLHLVGRVPPTTASPIPRRPCR
ncbi:hypothetical protein [Rhodococcus pyridinivorans]|uniref:hypothetical protein n=1 Tax=Rhodococcus pyridinivorans TaxID=103816 RepID=UPI00228472FD|nr:hypothetical protein [Rhodococcus pyridinivorans]WAL44383.1 hypothetical protein OQN32_12645 [Rhodococcus pyridinivorans]